MAIHPIFFYAFAILAIACALLVVFKKNPVSSAFNLVFVFFAFAGIYAMMDAHLLAGLQVLVYAGAVMVLFVFVIMLLAADVPSFDFLRPHKGLQAMIGAAGIGFFCLLVWAFKNSGEFKSLGKHTAEVVKNGGGNTKVISQLMFSEYVLPFELTSALLLGAIVAVVAIAMRKSHGKGQGSGEKAHG
ncbi:MAG: NADH-quinone oxidoreductase subunit J [Bacteriovoracia bacterium]